MVEDGNLQINGIIYILVESEQNKIILQEMCNVPNAVHPSYQKTLRVVKKEYYWLGMKKEVVRFIIQWLEC